VPIRFRKTMLRAFAYASGAGGSGFPGNLLDTVSIRELDYLEEFLPVDTLERAIQHLEKRGLTPRRATSYRFACEEGWASPPTNAIQKAIWEQAHAIPQNPMKIEFDQKQGR